MSQGNASAPPLRTVAVVLAGGTGSRVGLDVPKQLIRVAGKPIIEHTIAAFQASDLIDEIIIMMTPGHLDPIRAVLRPGAYPKVTQLLEGGETRNSTTGRALDALGTEECNVLLHDAVRPLVSQQIITDCVRALETHEAVDTVIPSADTIVEVDGPEGRVIKDVPPRAVLRRGQTPQGFRLSVIREAYRRAAADSTYSSATDDCTLVLRYCPGVPIAVVPGDECNLKVTQPIDVFLADRLFQVHTTASPQPRSPEQLREVLTDRCVVVFGGAYGIGAEIAELASSHGAAVMSFSRSATGTHVERKEDIERAFKQVMQELGRVDYVVNAAGMLPTGPLASTSEETVYLATEVNYLAPITIAQVFYPALRESRGSLLLFTSSSHTRGRSGYSLYSSAKAATVNLTQALADEWAPDRVRVNCINPERTATPMRTRAFGAEAPDSLLDPRTVALASIEVLSSSLTGHVVDVRRGMDLSGAFDT
jgi:2-C-methyl-D-erythritol 4-phosphate cytidylyltransferase